MAHSLRVRFNSKYLWIGLVQHAVSEGVSLLSGTSAQNRLFSAIVS